MLHQQLKEFTASSHAALENELVNWIRSIKTTADYVVFLRMLYGYYSSLETTLEKHLLGLLDDFDERRKAGSLLNDIQSFASVEDLAVCSDIPLIDSEEAALGAQYVLEGSTLGGQIIARMITNQLQLQTSEGLSFFLSYGEKTGTMWSNFKEKLNNNFSESERESVIRTADQTFLTFKQWVHANKQL